jgi:DNA-binding response OmpR family regulator
MQPPVFLSYVQNNRQLIKINGMDIVYYYLNYSFMTAEKKILIVDDDIDLCNLIYEIIKDEGYSVNKAYDGNSALAILKQDKFDLMIIDNKLGAMSGLNIIESSKDYASDLKTLMISAYGNKTTKDRAVELGVCGFIDKPFDIIYLVNKIKLLLWGNVNKTDLCMI